jgi:hypothetical protein
MSDIFFLKIENLDSILQKKGAREKGCQGQFIGGELALV